VLERHMLWSGVHPSVCLSVCHTPVFYRNCCTHYDAGHSFVCRTLPTTVTASDREGHNQLFETFVTPIPWKIGDQNELTYDAESVCGL